MVKGDENYTNSRSRGATVFSDSPVKKLAAAMTLYVFDKPWQASRETTRQTACLRCDPAPGSYGWKTFLGVNSTFLGSEPRRRSRNPETEFRSRLSDLARDPQVGAP
jgi:hypothetical protein